MAKRATKATTPPKGRPTRRRDLRPPSRNGRAIAGWLLVTLLVAVLIGAAIYIGSSQEVRIPGTVPAEPVPEPAADPATPR